LSDALTDAIGWPIEFKEWPGVEAHKAMLDSAREVLANTRKYIDEALKANKGFQLVVVGHSLGAATAILCTLILTKTPATGNPKLRCFGYAPTPIVSKVEPFKGVEIYAFKNHLDVVPSASFSNVTCLLCEMLAVDNLDLTLSDRISIVTKEKGNDEILSKVNKAVGDARRNFEQSPPTKANPTYIPGTLFWITPPFQAPGPKDPKPPPDPELFVLNPMDRQELYLKGGLHAGMNHMITSYQAGLDKIAANMK